MTAAVTTTTNGTAPGVADAPKKNTLQAFFDRPEVRAKLAQVAASFMKPDDLIRLALMGASRQPDLLKCSPQSVLRALMDAADMGIPPRGTNGRGYLVPRKNKHNGQIEACFDPGWRGLADIARRSGKVDHIEAHPVYANDVFSYEYGMTPSLRHVPATGERGALIAAYAIADLANGKKVFEVVLGPDLAKIKATSASANGPWKTWEDEMARKSAVRRLCKYLPISDPALERAIELATDVESGDRSGEFIEPALVHGDTKALEDALMGPEITADGEVVDVKAEVA